MSSKTTDYTDRIVQLAEEVNEALDINLFEEKDTDVTAPTMAFSQFLINKEQGDWAEQFMKDITNDKSDKIRALEYGRSEDKVAGEPGFAEYYQEYHEELATIGKCPDLLVFEAGEPNSKLAKRIEDIEGVSRSDLVGEVGDAVAGLEVRSSAYVVEKYHENKQEQKEEAEQIIADELLKFEEYAYEIMSYSLEDRERFQSFIDKVQSYANARNKDEAPQYRITSKIKRMAGENLGTSSATEFIEAAERIRAARKETFGRDYLSITAKVEDFVVILNWIRTHGIPHYYVQVFFDSAYIIPFERILEILASPEENSSKFQFERNEKNQMKYTIHLDINEANTVATGYPYPETTAKRRVFDDGRVQNYVTFSTKEGSFDVSQLRISEYQSLLLP